MEKQLLLKEVYPITAFNAQFDFEFDYLILQKICFIDAKYTRKGKTLHFEYDMQHLKTLGELDKQAILKLLMNLIRFHNEYKDFVVEFKEDQLFVDFSYLPKFLKRDVHYQKRTYFNEILVLGMFLWDRKDNYEYYEISGLFQKYKDPFLKQWIQAHDLQQLWECCLNYYEK